MRLPRMTTRRWMIAVAVVGLLCLLGHRRRAFESRATYHESRQIHIIEGSGWLPGEQPEGCVYFDGHGRRMTREEVRLSDWHKSLADKYRRAALYPWLPVEPDPPETQ